jgi:hypothetical protein
LLFVVTQVLDAGLYEADGIILIVDGKGARVAFLKFFNLLSKNAYTETVKCGDERRAPQAATFE